MTKLQPQQQQSARFYPNNHFFSFRAYLGRERQSWRWLFSNYVWQLSGWFVRQNTRKPMMLDDDSTLFRARYLRWHCCLSVASSSSGRWDSIGQRVPSIRYRFWSHSSTLSISWIPNPECSRGYALNLNVFATFSNDCIAPRKHWFET